MPQLPIRTLTLYKQGIGYFERRGEVSEPTVSLVVPRDATNDVLKSLNVATSEGGQVVSVDYETPEDKLKVLSELSVKLADRSTMVDLLSSLRGTEVALHLDGDTQASGRIIGVEASLDPAAHPPTVLIQNDSEVQVFPIAQLHGLVLHDARASTDVGFFLDVSRIEQTRTTLTVQLSEGTHHLEISYLAPSPIWRVSYRLISSAPNQARLVGWGLFDNSLDEDLENVSLTLVSGRPISFEYDLYESRIPSRPEVSDHPNALEAMSGNPLLGESMATISHELRTPLNSIVGYAELLDKDAAGPLNDKQREFVSHVRQSGQRMLSMISDLLDMVRLKDKGGYNVMPTFYRAGPLGDLKVSGSYFLPVLMGNAEPEFLTYRVANPISVRRGQSAMVPIIDTAVTFEELCVYNGAKMPNHPLLVWRFQNSTGVALEQGPVTLTNQGQYLGEGLMRFTGVGDDIQIAYALEFGILVTETTEFGKDSISRVVFNAERRQAEVSYYTTTAHHFKLTSHISRAIVVLIEQRDPSRGEYFDMPEPALKLGGHTRWSVLVPANGEAEFTVHERESHMTYNDVTGWKSDYIGELHAAQLLTDAQNTLLKQLAAEKQQLLAAADQIKALQVDYDQVVSRQEQLRKNLAALGESEREVAIRNRILDDLEASENRRRTLETSISDLNRAVQGFQDNQRALLDQLFSTAPSTE